MSSSVIVKNTGRDSLSVNAQYLDAEGNPVGGAELVTLLAAGRDSTLTVLTNRPLVVKFPTSGRVHVRSPRPNNNELAIAVKLLDEKGELLPGTLEWHRLDDGDETELEGNPRRLVVVLEHPRGAPLPVETPPDPPAVVEEPIPVIGHEVEQATAAEPARETAPAA
jgi:hypothetical protein